MRFWTYKYVTRRCANCHSQILALILCDLKLFVSYECVQRIDKLVPTLDG